MIKEIVDVLGNALRVGDYVAFGDTTSSNNAVVCVGKIEEINKKKITTEVIVSIEKHGGWGYRHTRRFIYPRNYSNLVKIS